MFSKLAYVGCSTKWHKSKIQAKYWYHIIKPVYMKARNG